MLLEAKCYNRNYLGLLTRPGSDHNLPKPFSFRYLVWEISTIQLALDHNELIIKSAQKKREY